MKHKVKPVDSRILDGMSGHVEAQAEAVAELSGEELTSKLLEPIASIDRKAGEMERESPLFFGTGENPALFQGVDE